MSERYKSFTHRECECFPCHLGVDKKDFNCKFCFCPLYSYGDQCGGNFIYHTGGIKDCSLCTKPHEKGSHDYIMMKLKELRENVK